MLTTSTHPDCASWIELSQKAFQNNVSVYQDILPKNTLLGCVLKGNAYGHGFIESLSALYSSVDIIFLISPRDGLKVRAYEQEQGFSHKRVVVLGAVSAHEVVECAKQSIEIVISHDGWQGFVPSIEKYASTCDNFTPLRLHLHIDTGLGREGFSLNELPCHLEFLKKYSVLLHIEGVMTHFANVEDVTEQSYALEQIQNLEAAYDLIVTTLNLLYLPEKHVAQSAASLILPNASFHIARVGVALYGLWPSRETKISAKVVCANLPKLEPVLSWKCASQCIKAIPEGAFIGYGCTFRADRDLKVCLLPVGYFDGYPRLLSDKAFVLINGRRCNLLGRVMMNHIVVDVTQAVKNETSVVATLIGTDGKESISVETCAAWAQTINYEFVTRLGPHLKRVLVE